MYPSSRAEFLPRFFIGPLKMLMPLGIMEWPIKARLKPRLHHSSVVSRSLGVPQFCIHYSEQKKNQTADAKNSSLGRHDASTTGRRVVACVGKTCKRGDNAPRRGCVCCVEWMGVWMCACGCIVFATSVALTGRCKGLVRIFIQLVSQGGS